MEPTASAKPTALPLDGLRGLLDRARSDWRRAVLLRCTMLAGAALLAVGVALVVIDQLGSLPAAARAVMRWIPLIAALVVVGRALRRVYPGPEDGRIALALEERYATLEQALTASLAVTGDGPVVRAFASRAASRIAELTARRPLIPANVAREGRMLIAGVLAASALILMVPGGFATLADRWLAPVAAPALGLTSGAARIGGGAAARANGFFGAIRVTIEPPSYLNGPIRTLRTGGPIVALAGSRLTLTGRDPDGAASVEVRELGGQTPSLTRADGSWRVDWTVAPDARGISLEALDNDDAAIARHIVPVAVVADREPEIELVVPDDDLVLASPDGTIDVLAMARDDYGIASFTLSWILSRGSGESFSFTDGTVQFNRVQGADTALEGRYRLDLGAAGLKPGDVMHLRAIARDRNTVTGPGEGVSRTRVIRIARESELDEVNTLLAFPMEVEREPILSQRMIILLTERLIERIPQLSAIEVRDESDEIALEQARLRERLADIIYARTSGADDGHDHGDATNPRPSARRERLNPDSMDFLEWSRHMQELLEAASEATGQGTIEELSHNHDPDPALAVNINLVPAFNAMYEAERWLRQAEPVEALPHAYRALEILQRVREAERVFARGRQTVAPVDVTAARGTGAVDDAAPAPRSAGDVLPTSDALAADVAELTADLEALAARDASLALAALAVRALEDGAIDPEAGALLGRAAEAAAAGRTTLAADHAAQARARLLAFRESGTAPPLPMPVDPLGAMYFARIAPNDAGPDRPANVPTPERPFVFATIRYASGDWDSAQLVPANIVHAIAQYTDIPVAPEGEFVDLDSPDLFRYPFLFMTGHLPVRFTSAEARNLREYVERGGFVFIDDHNHDIDGAFHRTVTAELARIFGPDALVQLANDHELYHTFFAFDDGPPTTSHELNGWGDGLVHEHLFAIERNGRIGVLYSNKDYASEWSYHIQNKRFLSLDNTRFGVNIVVYALTR